MLKFEHSIREQRLEVEVDSEALALALQSRLADVNRQHFLPVIERVLDELAVPGQRIRIDKLKVNLGAISFAAFEEVATERLYLRLREALEEAMRGAGGSLADGNGFQPEETSRLELLEHYLLYGMLPFWASRAAPFSLEALLFEIAENDPGGLVEMIRRHSHRSAVLERLVLQLREESLQRLLHLLEPEHALLIIAYMGDMIVTHRAAPVLSINEGQFSNLLWLLVLSYIVQDPGTQFNRKRFMESLLKGMGRSVGLGYAELLVLFRRGLQEMDKRHSLKSSLPGVIGELLLELDAETARRESLRGIEAQAGDARTQTGDARAQAGEAEAEAGEAESYDSTEQGSRELAARRDSSESMQEYISQEEHTSDALSLAALSLLESYLGGGELPAPGETVWKEGSDPRALLRWLIEHDAIGARRLIREIALRTGPGISTVIRRLLQAFSPEDLLMLMVPEAQASIALFVEVLTSARARSGDAVYEAEDERNIWTYLLEYLLSERKGRFDLRGALPTVLGSVALRKGLTTLSLAAELARELKSSDGDAKSLSQVEEALRQFLREDALPAIEARPAFARYDYAEILRYYFRYGVLPWGATLRDSALTIQSALKFLPSLSRPLLRVVFSIDDEEERVKALTRAVGMLPEEGLAALLDRLFYQAKEKDSPFRSALAAFAAETANKEAFYARLIAANLEGLALDLEEFAAAASMERSAAALFTYTDFDKWEAHALKSALAQRLRFGDESSISQESAASILHTLLTMHAEEARPFLVALSDRSELLTSLVRQSAPQDLDLLLDLFSPEGSETLRALMRSLNELPAPLRPGTEESVRQIILYEAIGLAEGEPLTAELFARLLRKLFGASLPSEAAQFLLDDAAAQASSEGLPKAQVAALRAAVESELARAEGYMPVDARAVEEGAVEERAADELGADERAADELSLKAARAVAAAADLREAVLAFMSEESSDEIEPGASETKMDTTTLKAALSDHALSDDARSQALLVMLDESPELISDLLHRRKSKRSVREHWVKSLSESALVRLSYLLEPKGHRLLLDTAEVLYAAWLETTPRLGPARAERESYWSFLLQFLSSNTEANRSVERLVTAFFQYFGGRYEVLAQGKTDSSKAGARLLERAGQIAQEAGQAALLSILSLKRNPLLYAWSSKAEAESADVLDLEKAGESQASESLRGKPRPVRARTAFSLETEEKEEAVDKIIYINNAGLVLTAPFLPHLFGTLGLLHEDDEGRVHLRNIEAVSRAAHLLQYLVDGRTDAPEPLLVLNKIMCGVAPASPVEREIQLKEEEREMCEQLLTVMIGHWEAISNTSIAGLRETFLQRDGKLELTPDGWKLRVQRQTLDVLVDRIPWSISVAYNKWMPQPVYVTW